MSSSGSITLARRAVTAVETLHSLGDRAPSDAERDVLAAWPGWGVLAPAFDPVPEGPWVRIADRLGDVLDATAHGEARSAVDNAFYTPPHIVKAIFGVLRSAGFTGGRVLEPGCGSGAFMRHAPDDLPMSFVGVERDPTSARIAAALHRSSTIINGRLECSNIPGPVDVVVGNVPFPIARS